MIRTVLIALALLTTTSRAVADVAPENPCSGKDEGDSCETTMGKDGVCEEQNTGLECVADSDDGDCSVQTTGSDSRDAVAIGLCAAALLVTASRRRKRIKR